MPKSTAQLLYGPVLDYLNFSSRALIVSGYPTGLCDGRWGGGRAGGGHPAAAGQDQEGEHDGVVQCGEV